MAEVRQVGGLYMEVSFKSLATPIGRQDQLRAIRAQQEAAPGGAVFVAFTCTPTECGFAPHEQERVLSVIQGELSNHHLTEVTAVEEGTVKTIVVFSGRQDDEQALKLLDFIFSSVGIALAFARVIPGKKLVERVSALDTLNNALARRHSRFRVSAFLTQQQ